MPGCAAVGCNNRSEKGYIMKCFPRDPELRKIWQERVARADWEPSNNSFLCHVHFEPQQWSITRNGRIRLKKNAVPCIFNVTSTRKSPKKRTKTFHDKGDKVEYMENDTELSPVEHLDEKDLDLQDVSKRRVVSAKYNFKGCPDSSEKGKVGDIKADNRGRRITMIAEDNLSDISRLVKGYNFDVPSDDDKKESGLSLMTNASVKMEASNAIVKEEIKLEVMDQNTFEDSYDEIEEKLKQICDGGSTEDENYKNGMKKNVTIKSQKEDEDDGKKDINGEIVNNAHKVSLSVETTFPTESKVGHILADKEENVEIIFGTESGDEKIAVPQSTSKLTKLDSNDMEYDEIISVKDEKKIFNEDIEENFTKDEVHVIPNIRAAMKRKRRTREEIMKSIKKSIRSTSDRDADSLSDSDASEDLEMAAELPLFSRNINSIDTDDTGTAKFVIKVTGDPDDVTEIMEELSCNTIGPQVSQNEENESLVTSVVTVLSSKNPENVIDREFGSSMAKDDYVTSSKTMPIATCLGDDEKNFTRLHSEFDTVAYHCFKYPSSNEEEAHPIKDNSLAEKSTHTQNISENNAARIPPDYEDLQERIQIQEDVIAKLIDQLIIYKELEISLRSKSNPHEIQARDLDMPRINTRSSNVQSLILSKKNLESKQRLIEDLSNRVNYFEEMNKKLMKTVTQESQQKRKLEGQIKQKDNRIKELNWKLEKASKYLERAEKNTNTYRRKMLNMQTIMRRRKLLDEKMSKFNEMLIDSSKQEFSDKVLAMAADIRKVCGRNGYDKLLSYGFPLPPLPALRKGILGDDFAEPNKSNMDELQNSSNASVKSEKTHNRSNESDIDSKDIELPDSVNKIEYEGTETVTGTVQDIFDENNDGDDFSTNELREHFILQLNAVM